MKFAFHMPTYRQQDWFGQCGWFPSRSTTNSLINYAVATLGPLHQQLWRLLLRQPILLGDDTRLRVLLRGAVDKKELATLSKRSGFRQAADNGQASTGPPGSATSYAWLYTGLDGFAPYNVFHWSLVHQNAVIDGHLATYCGIFVGDACGANARLEQRSGGRIVHASCNTHARREFVKAESNDPVLASQGISFYRQLYDVEERALEDVLRKLADAEQHHPADLALDSPCLLALLPNRWALTHPESVREGRVEEREDVLDAKRLRRTRARIEARAAQAAGS